MVSTSKYPGSSILTDYDNGSQLENSQQEYTIPNDLFIISDITDKRVESNVMDPILNNLFDKTKGAFIRFHRNKLVNNPILYANFEKYRDKLRQEGINPNEVYGFIQLPNGDHGEEDELCAYGVRVGMNYRGDLADASKGVYLSRFADTCTPCAFINDQCLRILVCKVLLGKSRRVLPSPNANMWTSAPDFNYNSYMALSPDNIRPDISSPFARYINSLIYVYEYVDDKTTADRPSGILPISVVEIQCNKPGPDFLNILVPRNINSTVWTGTLHLQKYLLKHVTMHSPFVTIGRPRGLDNLLFKVTVPYDTVANALPIKRLLQEDMVGAMLQQPEILLEDQLTPMYIQYFVLKCDECEQFDNLCTLMRKFELVGVNKLPSDIYLFLIPNGGLSLKLGLCLFNTATFHCVALSSRSINMSNTNWQSDPFETRTNSPPSQSSLIGMNLINAYFKKHMPTSSIPTSPVVMSPLNFNVPPPNFKIPPPVIRAFPPSLIKAHSHRSTDEPSKTNFLDPRLANNRDPRRANQQLLDDVEIKNSHQKPEVSNARNRSKSPNSDEDALQIDEGSPPKLSNERKRSLNTEDAEDIDLRQPSRSNGQQSSTSKNMFASLSARQAPLPRMTRFGPQAPSFKPPSLVPLTRPLIALPKIEPGVTSNADKIIVIVDPDLFISPVLRPEQLQEIFNTASEINRKKGKASIVFKWHSCITNELRKQKDEAPLNSLINNRARKFIDVEQNYIELIDALSAHLCDNPPRSAQKYLICCLNVKRTNKNERIIFLSSLVTSQSPLASNFVNENIILKTPDEITKSKLGHWSEAFSMKKRIRGSFGLCVGRKRKKPVVVFYAQKLDVPQSRLIVADEF